MRFISILKIILFIWLLGLIGFIIYVSSFNTNDRSLTDSIVVFTGGKDRIKTGANLLKAGYAPILFISGVSSPGSLQNIIAEYGINKDQVIYGLEAANTKQNAIEIADFVVKYNIASTRLVTSAYHLPRALIETKSLLPDNVVTVPHPVYNGRWNVFLLFKEYNKCLVLLTIKLFE
jgi:uncharacterized SAM-binding protein YcdF (DUF218 family)